MRSSFLRRAPSSNPRKHQVSSRRRPAKLSIEQLEDRLAPAVIDLFTTVPPHLVSVAGQGATSNSLGGLADVIGGSREITIVNNGPDIAQNVTAVAINQSDSNAYDQNQTRPGSIVTTRWDGNANGSLDATGLGGIDLTTGGSQNAFRLGVLVDDLPVPLSFRVYTDATHFSVATLDLPGGINTSTSFVLPFSSFSTGPGAAGPANLANVGAVEMVVDGTTVALDLQLELLDTVGQVDLSLDMAVDNSTPSVGDVVTYSVTVSNANGPDVAPAIDIRVSDLLPTGLVYVGHAGAGIYDHATGIWDLTGTPIAPGGSQTLQVQAEVLGTGTITNYAQVYSIGKAPDPQVDTDSTPGNDSGRGQGGDPPHEDDDASAQVVVVTHDFGDAPDSFGTLLANNGARHVATGPTLGTSRDSETDGQPDATATGDGADEDGVTGIDELIPGLTRPITVTATQPGVLSSRLNAWIDFNQDGDFLDPGEQVFTNQPIDPGSNSLTIDVPADATLGMTYARFRLTLGDVANPAPDGLLPDGEVEDYRVSVNNVADLSLAKTIVANPAPNLGENLTFQVTVSNAGPSAATGVSVRDLLPAGLTYVSDDSGGAFDSGTGTWTIGGIANGGTASILVTARVTASGTLTNNAQVRTSDQFDPDSTPGDDSNDQDDDGSVGITVAPADLGDAPNPYPTLLANDGARHVATGPTLGGTRDSENDGQPDATATGDGADEDGVTTGALTIGTTQTVSIGTTGGGFVNAWIDFNKDGDWDDAGEQVLANRAVVDGANFVVITVPLDGTAGTTFGRFRLTSGSVATPAPTGVAADGEVEDLEITVLRLMDLGDAPDSYGTTLAANGAGHVAIGVGPYLGTQPDIEADGQPSVNADGDGADEDGVTLPATLPGGLTANLTINAPLGGRLDAFIDYDRNGVFDAAERITPAGGTLLDPGSNTLMVAVPPTAVAGTTYARFRVSSNGGLGPTGQATDGEVEDYQVAIVASLNRITGRVYKEISRDGIRQANEPGLQGVSVRLEGTNDLNQVVDVTVQTDDTGFYTFDDLRPGTYKLTETQPAGFSDGLEAVGTPFGGSAMPLGQDEISSIVIPAGSVNLVGVNYDFGERGTTLSGVVFLDGNRDAVRATTEGLLGGVSLTLIDSNGNVVASTTTLIDGTYQFNDVPTGSYTVVQTQPNGYGSSTPNVITVTVPAAGLTNLNFGETTSTLAGKAYVDANGNGTQELGEPGIPGVVLQLTGTDVNGLPVTRSAATGADGSYLFTGLLAGTYTVTETQPANHDDGLDQAGTSGGTVGNDVVSNVTLGAAVDATGYDFGEVGTIVSGRVYVDANRNGTADTGDSGLPGQVLSLRDSAGNVVAIATTQADGTYVFNLTALGLAPGNYTILEAQPVGYGSSEAPSNARAVTVPVGGLGNQNFGETLGSLSGHVFIDANNDRVRGATEQGIGGVLVRLLGTAATGAPVDVITYTAGDGTYRFDGLLAANASGYAIFEGGTPGHPDGLDRRGIVNGVRVGVTGNDVITAITLGGGQVGTDYDFGERAKAIRTFVEGTVFTDANINGTLEAGEAGLAGVTVRLRQGDTVVATTTTLANGTYRFANILPSSYTIEEVQPAGYDSTSPNFLVVSVPSAGLLDQNFGEFTLSLKGNVYVDADNDGVRDPDEAGIAGVIVTLTGTDANGPVNRTTTTAADGSYTFVNVLGGSYTVTETQPAGYADGLDTPGSKGGTSTTNDVIDNFQMGQGVNATDYNFGELLSGLSGRVYVDLNDDGVRQPNEPGISGVTITATGPVTRTTTTAFDGTYSFGDLPPGIYTLAETQPSGYGDGQDQIGSLAGAPGNDVTSNITLPANTTGTGYVFGEIATVVTGTVYVDSNGNGTRDAGEPGLGGVLVQLRDTGNDVLATTTTGADGSYLFPITTPGNYVLLEAQATGYGSSEAPTNVRNITVPAAGLFNQNFGETLSSISGSVYQDVNANGQRDATDTSGVGGVRITLTGTDAVGRPVTRTTQTDATGAFAFTGLLAGTYTLTQTQPLGYFDSLETAGSQGGTRANDVISGINLPAATNATSYLLGETPPVNPFGYVFHDANDNGIRDAGEAGIAGVVILITGTVIDPNAPGGARAFNPATDDRPARQGFRVTDANGFWQFLTLPQGTYAVGEAQPRGWTDGREQNGDPSDLMLVQAARIAVSNDVFSNVVLANQQVSLPVGGIANLALRGPLNFGELRPNTISGRVFTDSNGNNVRDAGEPLVAGVRILLSGRDDRGNQVRLLTTTTALGAYSFRDLRPSDGNGYVITMFPPVNRLARRSFVGSLGGRRLAKNQVLANLGAVQGANGLNYDFSLEVANLGLGPFIGR